MKLFAIAAAIYVATACSSPAASTPPMDCKPSVDSDLLLQTLEVLVVRIEQAVNATSLSTANSSANITTTIATTAATTTPTTTPVRVPSACELNRAQLFAFNPRDIHIPVCMAADGAYGYKPDQYQSDGISYCVDVNGNTIASTLKLFDLLEIQSEPLLDECIEMRQSILE